MRQLGGIYIAYTLVASVIPTPFSITITDGNTLVRSLKSGKPIPVLIIGQIPKLYEFSQVTAESGIRFSS